MLREDDVEHHLLAISWLLGNMAWHSDRLSDDALYPYAFRAAEALAVIPQPLWSEALAQKWHLHPVWMFAERLRQGDILGQIGSWQYTRLRQSLTQIQAQLAGIAETSRKSLDYAPGRDAAERFAAIKMAYDSGRHCVGPGSEDGRPNSAVPVQTGRIPWRP